MKFAKDVKTFLKEPNYMVLGTLRKDGSIQMTLVWFDYDGKNFSFSTTTDRVKHKNLSNDPRATFVICDRENPYRYVQVQGKVIQSTKVKGHDYIDMLAKKYMGRDTYPYDPHRMEDRITYTISPTRHSAVGFDRK